MAEWTGTEGIHARELLDIIEASVDSEIYKDLISYIKYLGGEVMNE